MRVCPINPGYYDRGEGDACCDYTPALKRARLAPPEIECTPLSRLAKCANCDDSGGGAGWPASRPPPRMARARASTGIVAIMKYLLKADTACTHAQLHLS